ncbi:transglycosylase domain-containing protein [Streptomyces sp. NPDC093225]|uniref:transglycosylase domain-containing protein n=1 Tax=Streptomyces sp. NPDC093225 TaxID=3366034 RepID=UPI003815B8B7
MSDESPQQGWAPRDPDRPAGPTPGERAADTPPSATGRPGRPPRTGWRRLLPTWRMLLGGLLLLLLLVAGALIAGYLLVDIPPANKAATAQSNVYLYADGSQLARDGEVNRVNVPLSQVPRTVQQAVLAAEDRDFYSERAVDPKAMLRAAWNTVTGKGKQSGSTITQQYVKNYYLGQEQTIKRKVKEFFIAIKLGREESKEDILEGYLNTSYFGRNAYGIQAAAQAYYGKDVSKLTTAEGAYLATLLNSPSTFDVVAHPQQRGRALARWNYVLDGMVKKKWLTPARRAAITFPEPGKVRAPSGMSGQRGYLVETVKDYLIDNEVIDESDLAAGGYRITTTIDKRRENAFVKAVQDTLLDDLDPAERPEDRTVRAGGVSIDPATGKVVALYGGIDYTKQYVNNATRHDYTPGSTFKPFVFTAAVQHDSTTQDGRRITPNTLYNGDNERPVQGSAIAYAPENEDQRSYGEITVRSATNLSVNTVYAQMAVDVGTRNVKQTTIDMGMPKDVPGFHAVPSMALGTLQASVLDMTQVYATLADHGRHTPWTIVDKVSKDGDALPLPRRTPKEAVAREAADTTTSILESVVESGTGTAAQAAGRPAAGKTGTAEDDKAAWFAGYTPDLVTVVSVMGQDPDTGALEPLYGALGQARVNGGGYPARIWADYTAAALAGTEPTEFDLELQPGAVYVPPAEPTRTRGPDRERPGQDQGPTQGQDQGRTQGQDQGNGNGNGGNGNGGTTDQGQDQGQDQGRTTGRTGGQDQGGTTDGGTTDGGGTTTGTTGGTTTGGTGGGPSAPRSPSAPPRPPATDR